MFSFSLVVPPLQVATEEHKQTPLTRLDYLWKAKLFCISIDPKSPVRYVWLSMIATFFPTKQRESIHPPNDNKKNQEGSLTKFIGLADTIELCCHCGQFRPWPNLPRPKKLTFSPESTCSSDKPNQEKKSFRKEKTTQDPQISTTKVISWTRLDFQYTIEKNRQPHFFSTAADPSHQPNQQQPPETALQGEPPKEKTRNQFQSFNPIPQYPAKQPHGWHTAQQLDPPRRRANQPTQRAHQPAWEEEIQTPERASTDGRGEQSPHSPARTPESAALLSPIFLTMKLAPMKALDDTARTRPLALSDDMPPPRPAAAEAGAAIFFPRALPVPASLRDRWLRRLRLRRRRRRHRRHVECERRRRGAVGSGRKKREDEEVGILRGPDFYMTRSPWRISYLDVGLPEKKNL